MLVACIIPEEGIIPCVILHRGILVFSSSNVTVLPVKLTAVSFEAQKLELVSYKAQQNFECHTRNCRFWTLVVVMLTADNDGVWRAAESPRWSSEKCEQGGHEATDLSLGEASCSNPRSFYYTPHKSIESGKTDTSIDHSILHTNRSMGSGKNGRLSGQGSHLLECFGGL
jgi:hypothetical protein